MPPLDPENDVTAYIVVEDFGQYGRAFRETDLAEADHDTIVRKMISGEYSHPLRVVAFNTVEGWSRDVSEEIANDVLDRAYDADTTLSADAKRFIDLHMTTGVKLSAMYSTPHGGPPSNARAGAGLSSSTNASHPAWQST
jgi:hypothetical protein